MRWKLTAVLMIACLSIAAIQSAAYAQTAASGNVGIDFVSGGSGGTTPPEPGDKGHIRGGGSGSSRRDTYDPLGTLPGHVTIIDPELGSPYPADDLPETGSSRMGITLLLVGSLLLLIRLLQDILPPRIRPDCQ